MPNTLTLDNNMPTLKNRVFFYQDPQEHINQQLSQIEKKNITLSLYSALTVHKYILNNTLYIVTVNNPKPSLPN